MFCAFGFSCPGTPGSQEVCLLFGSFWRPVFDFLSCSLIPCAPFVWILDGTGWVGWAVAELGCLALAGPTAWHGLRRLVLPPYPPLQSNAMDSTAKPIRLRLTDRLDIHVFVGGVGFLFVVLVFVFPVLPG